MKGKNCKRGLAIFSAFAVMFSMAGCGTKDSVSNSSEIEYVTWLNAGEDNPVIDGFNAESSDVKVKMNIVDGTKYETLMQPRMMSDNVPDVMLMQTGMFDKYKKSDWLADLSDTEAGKQVKDKEDYMKVLGNDKGEVLGIPVEGDYSNSTAIVFYNKKIFEKYNISIPQTEDEFFTICETLKQNGVDSIIFGGADLWTIEGEFTGPISNGSSLTTYGIDYKDQIAEEKLSYSDSVKKGLETFKKLVDGEYLPKATASMTYDQSVQYFADGKAAMIPQGKWLSSLEQITTANPETFELGAFLYPSDNKNADGKRVVSASIAKVLVVPKKSAKIDNAKKLINYFTSKPVLEDYLNRQNLNPLLDGIEVENIPLYDDYQAAIDDDSKVEKVFAYEKYKLPSAAGEAVTNAYQNILAGSTVEDEVKKIDEAFEQNKDTIELK